MRQSRGLGAWGRQEPRGRGKGPGAGGARVRKRQAGPGCAAVLEAEDPEDHVPPPSDTHVQTYTRVHVCSHTHIANIY